MLPTNWSLRQELVGCESFLLTYGSPKDFDRIDVVSHNLCLMHQILTHINCAVKKITKLSESPGTVPIVAKLYRNDSKNRKTSSTTYPAPRVIFIVITMGKSGKNEIWS